MNDLNDLDLMRFLIENKKVIIFLGSAVVLYYALPFFNKKIRSIRYSKMLGKSNIRTIDRMDGFEFEEYLKILFKKLGYSPKTTSKTGDFGADVVLSGRNKIVIQAKRHRNKVGISAVQEVYSAKAYYKADEAWVITNNYFTKSAKELADACGVKLLDRNELMKFIIKINPEQKKYESCEYNE